VNETEARLLGGGCAIESFASTVLGLGARGVVVTLGGAGCYASWSEAGERRKLRLAPARQPIPVYPTGCGDVFGATLAYALVRRVPVAEAVALASEVASLKAAREPLAALGELRDWAAAPLRRCFPAHA
jgi:sugar/nucleoside kinase (ribokinase family)